MRCKVWNDNPHTDWKEMFKGDLVTIPSGKSIDMEFYDAHEFKGQYSPIKLKPDETQDPKSFKMIRVEKIVENKEAGELEVQNVFPCNLCKKVFDSEETLVTHSEKMHADQIVVDEEAEQSAPKKKIVRKQKVEARA